MGGAASPPLEEGWLAEGQTGWSGMASNLQRRVTMSNKGRCGIYNVMSSKSRRKDLRNNGTKAEAVLWNQLKNKQVDGAKFRRQQGLGRYIVDFYCPEFRVVVELDGASHEGEEAAKYDAERTKYLERLGMRIIRFPNVAVLHEMESVLNSIRGVIHA